MDYLTKTNEGTRLNLHLVFMMCKIFYLTQIWLKVEYPIH